MLRGEQYPPQDHQHSGSDEAGSSCRGLCAENRQHPSGKYNLEYCNKITNAAGRRVWGFFGIEAIAKPNINGFSDVSERTYVPEDWR